MKLVATINQGTSERKRWYFSIRDMSGTLIAQAPPSGFPEREQAVAALHWLDGGDIEIEGEDRNKGFWAWLFGEK